MLRPFIVITCYFIIILSQLYFFVDKILRFIRILFNINVLFIVRCAKAHHSSNIARTWTQRRIFLPELKRRPELQITREIVPTKSTNDKRHGQRQREECVGKKKEKEGRKRETESLEWRRWEKEGKK